MIRRSSSATASIYLSAKSARRVGCEPCDAMSSVLVKQLALDEAALEAAEAAGQVHEAMLGRSKFFVNGALLAVADAARQLVPPQ